MQYWPRKRAQRPYARVRYHKRDSKTARLCGFAGYKVGMTHVTTLDESKTKGKQKNLDKLIPVTVVECPPLKILAARFYKNEGLEGLRVVSETRAKVNDKNLKRKIRLSKKSEANLESTPEYDDMTIVVYTQPSLTGTGKKMPEIFEMVVGGSKDDQLNFVKENIGKEVTLKEVFKDGDVVDVHGITKGKGYQGPVKRFGVDIRHHKSEKTKRGPGSLAGGWKAQGHMMYRVAHAGQMGYHQRTEYNKWIVKVGDEPENINPEGGFVRYGRVKNPYMLIKGSVFGPAKRLVRFNLPLRPNRRTPKAAPKIQHVSLDSKQK
ncbi:50S ribosomal protein L3 [Candidatus Woesearchaeota archaeon]|nr:50S ribosomal protein L3 [Candidatus Woesearchaeota archaeon]